MKYQLTNGNSYATMRDLFVYLNRKASGAISYGISHQGIRSPRRERVIPYGKQYRGLHNFSHDILADVKRALFQCGKCNCEFDYGNGIELSFTIISEKAV